MSNDLPKTMEEMVSAIHSASDFGVMLAHEINRYEGASPQDFLMVTAASNRDLRETLGETVFAGRFEHLVNEEGYHFLRARREMTVAEGRRWLAMSPYKSREATDPKSNMAGGGKAQKTLFLDEIPRLVKIYDEQPQQIVLSSGLLQEDSKITPEMYLPVKYKAECYEYWTIKAFPIWRNGSCYFLIGLGKYMTPKELLQLLAEDGLVPERHLESNSWLEPLLRYDLGDFYEDALGTKKLIDLYQTNRGYPMYGFEPFGFISYRCRLANSMLEPGMMALVRTK